MRKRKALSDIELPQFALIHRDDNGKLVIDPLFWVHRAGLGYSHEKRFGGPSR